MRWSFIISTLTLPLLMAQTPTNTPPLAFDVASVKPNKSNDRPSSNFPLGPGDIYVPNGGLFTARNVPLMAYISFAYKLGSSQIESLRSQLPTWVSEDRFDIQARADGDATKDQMRMMMRSLLAERFKLAIHSESRQASIYMLALASPGKTGPRLQTHPSDAPCSTAPIRADPSLPQPEFPPSCGGLVRMPPTAPGRLRWGARNVTIALIANAIPAWGSLGKNVLDQTGLTGTFDFSLEWAPDSTMAAAPPGGGVISIQSADSGPGFQEALKKQLGLKLVSQKNIVEVLIADHIEHPSEN